MTLKIPPRIMMSRIGLVSKKLTTRMNIDRVYQAIRSMRHRIEQNHHRESAPHVRNRADACGFEPQRPWRALYRSTPYRQPPVQRFVQIDRARSHGRPILPRWSDRESPPPPRSRTRQATARRPWSIGYAEDPSPNRVRQPAGIPRGCGQLEPMLGRLRRVVADPHSGARRVWMRFR